MRLTHEGPLQAVACAARKVPPLDRWTHTTADSNLETLALAGDLLDGPTATSFVLGSADLVENPTEFASRLRPAGVVPIFALKAINGLLAAADSSAHNRVAGLFAQPPVLEGLPTEYLARTLNELDFHCVATPVREALWECARQDLGPVSTDVLSWLAAHDYPNSKAELVERVNGGDYEALDALGGFTPLSSTDIESLTATLENLTNQTITDAQGGTQHYGGFAAAYWLTRINLSFPSLERWNTITELLFDPEVGWHDKRPVCWLIAQTSQQLPTHVRDVVSANIDSIATTATGGLFESRIGGIGTVLAIAIGAVCGTDATDQATSLAYGSLRERQDLALLLGLGFCPNLQPILAAQATDSHPDIRHDTAVAVGRLIGNNQDAAVGALAWELAHKDGIMSPAGLLRGLSHAECLLPPVAMEIVHHLRQHPSAKIRRAATRLAGTGPDNPLLS